MPATRAPALPPENVYGHTKKLRFVLDALRRFRAGRAAPVRLLDFGCGNGSAVSRYLVGEGIRYYGVDLHAPSLEHARARLGGEDATFHERVPAGVEFDVVVYADVLEHLHDPVAVLREHAAAMPPDGMIVGAVPNGYGPFELEKRIDAALGISRLLRAGMAARRALLRRPAPSASPLPYNFDSGHVQFYTRRSLVRTLERGGFRVERFANGAFAGAPASELLLLRGEAVARANARAADFLPAWAVSTWYFAARRAAPSPAARGRP